MAVLRIVLFLVVPGWLVALALLPRERRVAPAELAFASAAAAVLVSALVAHSLAAAGVFSRGAFFGVQAALALGLFARHVLARRALFPIVRGKGWLGDFGPFVLAGAAVWLFLPATEFLWGNADEGVYANAAFEIVRGGAICFQDELFDSLPASARSANVGELMPGFYFLDPSAADARFVPHAFHFFPAWLAGLEVAGGLEFSMAGPVILAVLAVVGAWLLAARFGGPLAGLCASVLVATNPATVWFARVTNAETMTLMLLLSGFALAASAVPREPASCGRVAEREAGARLERGWLLLAGALLGAVHLAKVEFLALPWAVVAFVVLLFAAGHRARDVAPFAAGYALLLVLATFHAFLWHRVYFANQLFNAEMYGSRNAIGYIGAFAGAVAAGSAAFALRGRLPALAALVPVRGLALGAGVAALLLAAYLYWMLPAQGRWGSMPTEELSGWQRALAVTPELVPDTDQRTWRETTFRQLGFYIGAVGVFAGTAGTFWMLRRREFAPLAPFLLLVLAQTAFFLLVSGKLDYGSSNPHTPGRRFLSLTIPGLLIASVLPWFAAARAARPGAARALRAVGLVVTALIGAVSLRAAVPIARNTVWQSGFATIDGLASMADERVVWIGAGRDGLSHRYLEPLRTLHRQKVFFLSNWITPEQVDALLPALREGGRIPVLLTDSIDVPDPLGGLARLREALRPEGEGSIQFSERGITFQRHHIPRDGDFGFWEPAMRYFGALPHPRERVQGDAPRSGPGG